jgi:rubrerythrin
MHPSRADFARLPRSDGASTGEVHGLLGRQTNGLSRFHPKVDLMPSAILPVESAGNNRRSFLSGFGKLTLSGTAIALLAGRERLALGRAALANAPDNDVTILNAALGAEHEAVAAYQLGAQSGLLRKPILDLAVQFQGHHKEHVDLLAKTVTKLGGKPVEAPRSHSFPTQKLKTEADVLAFAADLEKGAVSAYLGAVPVLGNRDLAKAAASILGDEAMHWAILRQALGQPPVPAAFVS